MVLPAKHIDVQPTALPSPLAPGRDRPLHVAVVGCGYWGPNHIRCFHDFPECRVTAVDLDAKRLQSLSQRFPRIATDTDFNRVLADPALDAVVIATPTDTHFELSRTALLAGKHVLCEKPLCTSFTQASELVELSQQRNLVLMTGHTFLFNPGIIKIKQLIDQGELGELLYLSAVRTNLGPIRSDVNAALDLAAHDVAIFNWLLESEPMLVAATGGDFVQHGIHDVVFINLTYPDGRVANIHASWLNPKKVRQMTVVGKRRMLTWDDLAMTTPVAIYDRGANAEPANGNFGEFLRVSTWDGDVRMPRVEPTEPLKLQSQTFVDSISDRRDCRSDGLFSLGVVRALEGICESLRGHGAPIHLADLHGSASRPPDASRRPSRAR